MIRFVVERWHLFEQRLDAIQPRQARRLIITVVGFTILLLGMIMIVLPGPAFVVIPAGLAILALEFTWAKFLLDQARQFASQVNRTCRGQRRPSAAGDARRCETQPDA